MLNVLSLIVVTWLDHAASDLVFFSCFGEKLSCTGFVFMEKVNPLRKASKFCLPSSISGGVHSSSAAARMSDAADTDLSPR